MVEHNYLFGVLLVVNMFGKNEVVSKALCLIQKLQHKYGYKPKFFEILSDVPKTSERDGELPTIIEEEPSDFDDEVCTWYCINTTFHWWNTVLTLKYWDWDSLEQIV